jgi:ribosomal protein S18 acetylase RimI-like enzyme
VTLAVRVGGRADAEAVLALWASSAATRSSTDDLSGVEGLLARDGEAILLAELEGRLVGTLIVGWDGWRAAMYRLVVAGEARRAGVARALVEHGEERLRALGARRVNAQVLAADPVARSFWESAGYEDDPGMTRYRKTL